MIFEVGKIYQHKGSKEKMFIIAEANISRIYYTPMLIGERENGALVPVGIGTDYAENWKELKENK